ncbi:hypothetical protein [Thermoactinospora rubra]|uniref:hypothetical protein n=1 Tax=Thermoactinospora rubra TaxID=1088767 RepID=UPI00117CB5AC|nr:hypothetical protein [Thermoactinospora rubra]
MPSEAVHPGGPSEAASPAGPSEAAHPGQPVPFQGAPAPFPQPPGAPSPAPHPADPGPFPYGGAAPSAPPASWQREPEPRSPWAPGDSGAAPTPPGDTGPAWTQFNVQSPEPVRPPIPVYPGPPPGLPAPEDPPADRDATTPAQAMPRFHPAYGHDDPSGEPDPEQTYDARRLRQELWPHRETAETLQSPHAVEPPATSPQTHKAVGSPETPLQTPEAFRTPEELQAPGARHGSEHSQSSEPLQGSESFQSSHAFRGTDALRGTDEFRTPEPPPAQPPSGPNSPAPAFPPASQVEAPGRPVPGDVLDSPAASAEHAPQEGVTSPASLTPPTGENLTADFTRPTGEAPTPATGMPVAAFPAPNQAASDQSTPNQDTAQPGEPTTTETAGQDNPPAFTPLHPWEVPDGDAGPYDWFADPPLDGEQPRPEPQGGWQPPQGFTAAAAGMQVWPAPVSDSPVMPPWPAATGEPLDGDHDSTAPSGQAAFPERPEQAVPTEEAEKTEESPSAEAGSERTEPDRHEPERAETPQPERPAEAPGAERPGPDPSTEIAVARQDPSTEHPSDAPADRGGAFDPSVTVPVTRPAEPGDVPVWPRPFPHEEAQQASGPIVVSPAAPWPSEQPGHVPQPPPPPQPGNGRKALFATISVLVVAGVATGGFFVYRSMNASPGTTGAVASATPTAAASPPPETVASTPAASPQAAVLDSEETDPRAMSLSEAFPEKKIKIGKTVYTRVATSLSKDCEKAASGPFADALREEGCSRVLRATYVDGKRRYAVTTGIAVMPTKDAAAKADKAKNLGRNLWFRALPGPQGSGAERVAIAGGYAAGMLWGRYIVFSYATHADGHTPTAKETALSKVSGAFRDETSRVLERRATGG